MAGDEKTGAEAGQDVADQGVGRAPGSVAGSQSDPSGDGRSDAAGRIDFQAEDDEIGFEGEGLDFTDELIGRPEVAMPIPSTKPYDPRPLEDAARRRIAYSLIALLSLIVLAMLVLLGAGVIKAADMKEFAVVLGPVVTLVSAATGFYYGTKTNPSG
ncbi:MAG TPA: hypothetical protein DDZ76_06960 [Xanthomonadales bacterium]|nr:hypothetical protein [Xanthomonadales bacterium]